MKHLAALLIFISLPACADVRVIDGDTIVMDGTRYRLAGIDAPEMSQDCGMGPKAAEWLAEYLKGKTITCNSTGKSYNRVVAACFSDGEDLQEAIVRNGWAFDSPRYSRGKYAAAEAEAKSKGRGIHAGNCEKPWVWRREQRRR
jgi:endonuclease YncB( thermonuclease family)